MFSYIFGTTNTEMEKSDIPDSVEKEIDVPHESESEEDVDAAEKEEKEDKESEEDEKTENESEAAESEEGEKTENESEEAEESEAAEATEESEEETGAPSPYIPREYAAPLPPVHFILNGHPVVIDKTSYTILHMYMRSICAGTVIGGGIGTAVGAVVGFAVSTVSIPFILLGNAIENAVHFCFRQKQD